MDLQKAYSILGLSEGCSLEELEEQYYLLTEKKITPDELENVQTAYNIVKEHIYEVNPPPKDPLGKRIGEFFYHYKNHLIFGFIGALIIGSLGYSFINGQIEKAREANKPPANLNIMFFGDYPEEELTPLQDRILDKFTTWDDVGLQLVYSPIEINSEFDIGSLQKSRVELATSEPDLYIFDKHHFDLFMEDGAFYALDDFDDEQHTEDRWYLNQLMDDEENHIYGLDISDLDLFADLAIEPFEKIAVMRLDAKNEENALEFLHTILQE